MAGRFSIEAVFKAVDRLSAPVGKMHNKVDGFIKGTEKGLGQLDKFNDKIAGGLKRAGAVTAGAAIATAAIVRDIVTTGAEFDRTLVGAAAKFNPDFKRGTKEFERLRVAAEKMGAATEFNAQQGAEALKALASAGLDANQAIAALPGVVDLATASEVDLGAASEMATKSLGAFGLKTDDANQMAKNLAHTSDVMAKAAGKTDASMEGLFESIKEGGPIAITAGQSMETFMAMAASLAGAGIEGSVAGTTLKNTMLSLAAPTAKAAKQLKKLGIFTKDSDGNLRDVVDIFDDLKKATAGMGTAERAGALERIFGKIPIAGVSALLDQGADKIRGLREELKNSDGYVKRLAATMRDTVAGDIDGFTSAIDGVKIALFSANNGPIRDVIKKMTEWVNANKELIVQKVGDAVKWIGDNLPAIVTWLERIAKGVAVFWVWSTAIKTVQLAFETYRTAVVLAKGAQWLFNKSLKGTRGAADGAAEGLAGMRTSLNASTLSKSINGITSTLGRAGMLGAALAVGVAIGSWLNETFELDKKISGWIAELTGLADKLGNRTNKRPDPATSDHVLQDGSVQAPDGTFKYKSPLRLAREQEARNRFHEGKGRSPLADDPLYGLANPLYVRPPEPQVVSPQQRVAESITQHTEKASAEITIKDETGKASVTEKPKAPAFRLVLQRSGAF